MAHQVPILNISNNKIIGIHKQSTKTEEYNIGSFLSNFIKEYISLYNNFKQKKIYNYKSKIEELIKFLSFEDLKNQLIINKFRPRTTEPNETPEKISNRINLIFYI